MGLDELAKQLISLEEGHSCFLNLRNKAGNEFRCECKFLHAKNLHFSVLPTEGYIGEWDPNRTCSFFTAPGLNQPSISCEVRITNITDNLIELVATSDFAPAALRNYFRVNLRVPVTVSRMANKQENSEEDQRVDWSTSGQTVNISRSGILTILQDETIPKENLLVSLDLPNPKATVELHAQVIRVKRLTKTKWLTALHFDQEDSEQCDIITSNCLQEQRRQIREKVEIAPK